MPVFFFPLFYSFIDRIIYPYKVHQQHHRPHQLLTVIIPIIINILKTKFIIIIQSLNNSKPNSNNKFHHLSLILHHNPHLLFEYIQQEHQVMFLIHMLKQLINHNKQPMFNKVRYSQNNSINELIILFRYYFCTIFYDSSTKCRWCSNLFNL